MADHLPLEQTSVHWSSDVMPVAVDHLPGEHFVHSMSEERPGVADHLPLEQTSVHWSSDVMPVAEDHLP